MIDERINTDTHTHTAGVGRSKKGSWERESRIHGDQGLPWSPGLASEATHLFQDCLQTGHAKNGHPGGRPRAQKVAIL